MKLVKCIKVGIVIVLLMASTLIVPAQLAFAANGMISDQYLQNPDSFQDSKPAAGQEDSKSAAVGLGPWDYIKMLLSLIFVLGLLIVVLKFINKKNSNYQHNSLVRNIGGISVGSQKSVQLIHIGESLYIVGVGDNVQLIKEIKDPSEVEQLLNYYDEKQSIMPTTPYIAELMKKLNKKSTDNQSNANLDFGDLLNKRLTNIQKERHEELEKWKEKEQDK